MSRNDDIRVNKWLLPLSWLYGIGVRSRNFLFDVGALRSRAFSLPVISVGNITVGGTGKTPHVEYLVRLLKDRFRIAVLSRGYGRQSSGYVLATAVTTARDIGDEPCQMHDKFPDIYVAVDERRADGIRRLTTDKATKNVEAVILDDAFQHRHVRAGVSILLVDCRRMITDDALLPAGRLREPVSGKNRADVVIVTKCPDGMKPIDYRVIKKQLDLRPCQKTFFTTMIYGGLKPVFGCQRTLFGEPSRSCGGRETPSSDIGEASGVLLIAGIANPAPFVSHIKERFANVRTMLFGDHHDFSTQDICRINSEFEGLGDSAVAITTEKDAARLATAAGLSGRLKKRLFALPVRVRFLADGERRFDRLITNYVEKTLSGASRRT